MLKAKTFPQIDTTNTTGDVKSYNATIQGVVVATFVLGAVCAFSIVLSSIQGNPKISISNFNYHLILLSTTHIYSLLTKICADGIKSFVALCRVCLQGTDLAVGN